MRSPDGHAAAVVDADRVYRRVTLRIVPFLFVCYLFAYLDRVNVGFAELRMLDDLEMPVRRDVN